VRALPDIELEVVRLLSEHGHLAFNGAIFAVVPRNIQPRRGQRIGTPTRSDVVAIEVNALEMSKGSDPSQLLNREHAPVFLKLEEDEAEQNFMTSIIGLTPSGEELAKFIAD
jgi:hypothetical protein